MMFDNKRSKCITAKKELKINFFSSNVSPTNSDALGTGNRRARFLTTSE